MDEKNFDNKIKQVLENPPEMEVDFRAMADMRQRLKAAQPEQKRRGGGWWILPLFLLPFLLGGYFFHTQTQELQTQINQLQSQLSSTAQNNQIDSLHTSITYQFDTIYRTFYKDKIIERIIERPVNTSYQATTSPFYSSNLPYSRLGTTQPQIIQSILRSLGVPGSYSLSTHPNSFFTLSGNALPKGPGLHYTSPLDPNKKTANKSRSLGLFDPVPHRQWSMLTASQTLAQLDNEEQQLKTNPMESQVSADPLYHLVPTGFSLGIHSSPFVFTNAPAASGAFLVGLNAEIEFANRLRLQVGAGLLRAQSAAEDAVDFAGFPVLPPDTPGDLLKEVYGTFSYLQIPVGFKYLFGETKKWRPFLGAAMVAQRPIRQEFTFEYINPTVGEYKLDNSLSDGSFSINNLRANAGINYSITRSLSAEAGLIYHRSFEQNNGDYFKLNYWALDIGLKYGF